MSTLKNSMLELAAKFDDNYNTGLIKSFMFGLNKTEIKTMTDILSRYKFRDSHETAKPTEEAEFEEDLYKCETRLDDLEETEFGWIAGGRLQGTNTNNFSCYFLKDNDSVDDTLKLFLSSNPLA
ncbi:hypothetical protein TNCV_3128111 [Trichonephila clavipes]|nr:hypothetical protein TNCV_3128111 [Trichonephila clavipes]